MGDWLASLHAFHFQRPGWVLALPAAVAAALLLRRRHHASGWRRVIAPELAPYLLETTGAATAPRLAYWALLAWTLACLALAGPSWQRLPQPIYKQERALVILLDLSASLLARDLAPDRITRVRLKLLDLLAARREGSTALIAYAGDSHVVTPLTDDAATLAALLPALHPTLMPVPGNRPDQALAAALDLLANTHHERGDVLLVTDGVPAGAMPAIEALMRAQPTIRLSVLGVGTAAGAPVPERSGGFARNRAGDILIARLDTGPLQALAERHGGRYATLVADAGDLDHLTEPLYALPGSDTRAVERTFDTWQDAGHWLVLPLLPLLVLAFRRRLFALVLLAPLLAVTAAPARALDWDDLWLNPNQQGARALARGQPDAAASRFTDPAWQGVAAYRAGDYDRAAQGFAADASARGQYNRGNALARAGRLDEAVAAYDQALRLQPDFAPATANRALVDALREQRPPAVPAGADNPGSDPNGSARNDGAPNGNNPSDNIPSGGDRSGNDPDGKKPAGADQTGDRTADNGDRGQAAPGDNTDATSAASAPADGEHNRTGSTGPQHPADNGGADPGPAPAKSQAQAEGQAQVGGQAQAADPAASGRRAQADAPGGSAAGADALSPEQQQTLEQWLRRVPDDPSGLLRRKFDYESSRPRPGSQAASTAADEEL